MSETPLEKLLKEEIRHQGPVGIARLMRLALAHPAHGYYMMRDPFGEKGDFTTAPEISQMFGELIGLWAAERWMALGRPNDVCLVELGPGRGTLMADALRAIHKTLPGFAGALRLHLVEISPVLRARQGEALAAYHPVWHDSVDSLPQGLSIVIANEFFDALPIRQFERRGGAWHERLIGLDDQGRLAFGLAGAPTELSGIGEASEGAVFELAEESQAVMAELARHMAAEGGAAIIIDYGHVKSGFGDTLQALKGHAFVSPLDFLGEADITTHVDFEALAKTAAGAGVRVDALVTQADFLTAVGIDVLAERLKRRASPAQAAAIDSARRRLTDRSMAGPLSVIPADDRDGAKISQGMGELFKVLMLGMPPPHGEPD